MPTTNVQLLNKPITPLLKMTWVGVSPTVPLQSFEMTVRAPGPADAVTLSEATCTSLVLLLLKKMDSGAVAPSGTVGGANASVSPGDCPQKRRVRPARPARPIAMPPD